MRDHYDCFGKYLTDWFNDKKVPKGKMSKYNLIYLREYKDILAEYKKYSAMLFFILVVMKIDMVRQMFNSCNNTKKYIYKVICELKEKMVTNDYVPHFNVNIERLRKRLETMDRIIKEDLYLTEWYPYFMEKGFDVLSDFENNGNTVEQLQPILDDFEQWKIDNKDKLDAHIVEMQKKKDIYLAHKEKVKKQEKAEKEARKLAKKAANDEVKEIRKNNEKYRKEYMRLERSFNRYYAGK